MEESARGRILLVEDSKTQGIYYAKLLQSNGFVVELAHSMAAARQAMARQTFDLVLMDLILSEEYGLDLLQEIREEHTSLALPVVVFSVVNDATTRKTVLASLGDQANDFIPKGTDQDDLLSRLDGHIHLKNLNQQLAQALQENRAMAASARNAREDERRRLARSLHEGVMQIVVSIRLNLALLAEEYATASVHDSGYGFETLTRDLDEVVDQLRFCTERLGAVDFEGDRLQDLIQRWAAKVDLARRFRFEIDYDLAEEPLSVGMKTCIYRIVQEAITNSVRHSGGTQIWVDIKEVDDNVHIQVEDDGMVQVDQIQLGQGLFGIRERALSRFGAMQVEQSPHGGLGLSVNMHLHEGAIC